MRWVTLGSVVAMILWLLGSVVFSLFVNFFGDYNKTYGAIAGVIVLMLWLYLTVCVCLGQRLRMAVASCRCRTRARRPICGVCADDGPGL